MAETPKTSAKTRRDAGANDRKGPDTPEGAAPLGKAVRAREVQPHKGDVGRPGTNEEIYQGSKSKELP